MCNETSKLQLSVYPAPLNRTDRWLMHHIVRLLLMKSNQRQALISSPFAILHHKVAIIIILRYSSIAVTQHRKMSTSQGIGRSLRSQADKPGIAVTGFVLSKRQKKVRADVLPVTAFYVRPAHYLIFFFTQPRR